MQCKALETKNWFGAFFPRDRRTRQSLLYPESMSVVQTLRSLLPTICFSSFRPPPGMQSSSADLSRINRNLRTKHKKSDTKAPTMDSAGRHIFAWGSNEDGELRFGDAFSDRKEVSDPTKVSIENVTWTQIACGRYHTVALSINGEVFTWGSNDYGQLGHGDQKDRNVPTKVESLSGEIIVKIACGHDHTAVVTERGKVLTW